MEQLKEVNTRVKNKMTNNNQGNSNGNSITIVLGGAMEYIASRDNKGRLIFRYGGEEIRFVDERLSEANCSNGKFYFPIPPSKAKKILRTEYHESRVILNHNDAWRNQ